jgi:hypothetical protein
MHAEAKTCHGLARAVRRGLANMKIQTYLTAAAINLKRLAGGIAALLWLLVAKFLELVACAQRTTRAAARHQHQPDEGCSTAPWCADALIL